MIDEMLDPLDIAGLAVLWKKTLASIYSLCDSVEEVSRSCI